MAFTYGFIQRLKQETGYNVANVGAEVYVLNGYAAVFDAAIAPYLIDLGSTSTTVVPAESSPTAVSITLAANPPVSGAVVNVYGNVFSQGATVVVDVGPQQEKDVVILGLNGLVATVTLQKAHGAYGSYPVILQGGEFRIYDIVERLDQINHKLKYRAPQAAGVNKADDVSFYSSMHGRRGQKGVTDDLIEQRDWARKDLAAALGIQNLWEIRGKQGDGGAGVEFSPC